MKNKPTPSAWDLASNVRNRIENLSDMSFTTNQRTIIQFVVRDAIQAERNRRRNGKRHRHSED